MLNGIVAACHHTKMSHDQAVALSSKITHEILQAQVQEVTTTQLGEMVMQNLLVLDSIAYIRFACVYKRLKDMKELEEAIKCIHGKDESLII